MPVDVSVQGEAQVLTWLEEDCDRLMARADVAEAELSVLLCDDEVMRALNLEWRGKDAPTDVLSFPMAEPDGEPLGPGEPLGDVVIDLDQACRQGKDRGHGLDREVQVLLVHGFLHLLGYDHEDDGDHQVMEEAAARLLAHLPDR